MLVNTHYYDGCPRYTGPHCAAKQYSGYLLLLNARLHLKNALQANMK